MRLTTIGGSSYYGGAATGATPPKPVNSVVGLMRAKADAAYGPDGSGLVIPTSAPRTNRTYDPRFTFTGKVRETAGGFFGGSAWALSAGVVVTFTDTAETFRVWTEGSATIGVDGGASVRLAGGPQGVAAGGSACTHFESWGLPQFSVWSPSRIWAVSSSTR